MINATVSITLAALLTTPLMDTGATLESATAGRATTSRVSVADTGEQGEGPAHDGATNRDGRYVAFSSAAANLVPNDTNGELDTFVRDRLSGTTTLVSVANDGTQGNAQSQANNLSADGRFVAFSSRASNLVPGDTNDEWDAFVHDRRSGTTRIVSVSTEGVQANAEVAGSQLSADGRFVLFSTAATNLVPGDTNGTPDLFVRDLRSGVTSRVTVSSLGAESTNHLGSGSSISGDGRYVTFGSDAPNLVPGDTNESPDVFVHDRRTGATTRVNLTDDDREAVGPGPELGSDSPAISDDGRYVAFTSFARNLVPGDTNGLPDVFVRDRRAGTTRRVSVSSDGAQPDWASGQPSISADGRYVVFHSDASNLVRGDTNADMDVFRHDRKSHRTIRVSVSTGGRQSNSSSRPGQISADGQHVVFTSIASNLVPADTNERDDVFIWDRRGGSY